VTSPPPHLHAGERLRRIGVSAWAIIGIVIVTAIVGWILLKIRVIFPPLVLALLIIYLLNPPITRLARRGLARPLAAVLVFLLSIGILVGVGIGLFPFVSSQVEQFADDWPQFRTELVQTVEDTAGQIERRLGFEVNPAPVLCLLGETDVSGADCDRITRQLREAVTGQADRITEIGISVLEGILVFVLSPLLALYLLIDLPQLQRDLLNLFPESHRAEAADLGSKMGRAVGGFFRGQLAVAFLVGVLSALGFWIIGLPFWLIIGGIAGFFNLIPFAGPIIGGALGFFVGTISEGVGLGIQAAIVEVIVQQIDNHLISPIVMRRAVQLHPATVVLALLAGATLAGFWGVLLAVPSVAVAKILLGHLWATRILGAQVTPYATVRRSVAPSVVRGPPAPVRPRPFEARRHQGVAAEGSADRPDRAQRPAPEP
jgi:predicted PurR-regulated permease PerM